MTSAIDQSIPGMTEKLKNSINGVMRWVETHDYKAYDPGDGNLSYLHALTFNVLILERFLQQSVYRAPFNLRPLFGIKPHVSTKGMGYMAWGYLKMYGVTGDRSYSDKAKKCFDWLIENKSPFYSQYCWGNHFPFCTRSGKTPKLEPIIPWTALIGQSFLDAYAALKEPKYLEVATSIGEWILSLPREKTPTGDCISYVAFKQNSIHNSNMLAAAFLAQIGKLNGNSEASAAGKSAMDYSCNRLREDGSWYYGEHPKYHWIDNFHTGYNLDCLKRYIACTGDRDYDTHLRRSFDYFKNNFFEANGRPKYYHNQALPIDSQCMGQAIDTLAFFSDIDSESLGLAAKVADWSIDNMQARDGHFYYRDLGWIKVKTPMLHWGQGTMFKGMAHLLTKLDATAGSRIGK